MTINKFKASKRRIDSMLFDSQLEASYYCQLKILKRVGEVRYWLRQVSMHLPGGKKYVCDFLVFYTDGSHAYIDVKGVETQLFKLKKSIVEEIYPIEIKIVKKGEF